MSKIPIACQMAALEPEQQSQRKRIAQNLLQLVVKTKELNDGYAFRYPLKALTWMEIAEFVDLERRCCPFLSFRLELKSGSDYLWLYLTGKEGTKAFLEAHEDFAA